MSVVIKFPDNLRVHHAETVMSWLEKASDPDCGVLGSAREERRMLPIFSTILKFVMRHDKNIDI
ncbi:hypothetical protein [Xenorhabdus eapokensis]|uniref:hypothetical protein n=1 Tax=Xenorhabdus eapokensis TaxID=1873482 RepID=UPI00093CBFA5|nr:hypothetical protein [Xenorhabdus eapokensis]